MIFAICFIYFLWEYSNFQGGGAIWLGYFILGPIWLAYFILGANLAKGLFVFDSCVPASVCPSI